MIAGLVTRYIVRRDLIGMRATIGLLIAFASRRLMLRGCFYGRTAQPRSPSP